MAGLGAPALPRPGNAPLQATPHAARRHRHRSRRSNGARQPGFHHADPPRHDLRAAGRAGLPAGDARGGRGRPAPRPDRHRHQRHHQRADGLHLSGRDGDAAPFRRRRLLGPLRRRPLPAGHRRHRRPDLPPRHGPAARLAAGVRRPTEPRRRPDAALLLCEPPLRRHRRLPARRLRRPPAHRRPARLPLLDPAPDAGGRPPLAAPLRLGRLRLLPPGRRPPRRRRPIVHRLRRRQREYLRRPRRPGLERRLLHLPLQGARPGRRAHRRRGRGPPSGHARRLRRSGRRARAGALRPGAGVGPGACGGRVTRRGAAGAASGATIRPTGYLSGPVPITSPTSGNGGGRGLAVAGASAGRGRRGA